MDGQTGFQQGGFQPEGFTQSGFQQTYKIPQFDIDSLRSSLEAAAPQIAQALQVLQKIGPQTSQSAGSENEGFKPRNEPQQTGFQPQEPFQQTDFQPQETFSQTGFQSEEQAMELMESVATALKQAVGAAFASIDSCNMILARPGFAQVPGMWQSGFRDTSK